MTDTGHEAMKAERGTVRAWVRRVPVPVRWCAGVGAALCLVAGFFLVDEENHYADGREYGERQTILRTHVFDGDKPGGDLSDYADLAEQECLEHGADDGENTASPRWLEGCVDALLRR